MKKMKKIFRNLILAATLPAMLLCSRAKAAEHTAPYDPARDGILSGYLCIDGERGYLTGIAPGATLEDLNRLSLPGDLTTSAEALATGTVLTSEAAGTSLTAILTGDLNGDGEVSISDMLLVKSHILGAQLEEQEALAGDVNYDGDVTVSDFLSIKSALLGRSRIQFRASEDREPLVLLAPGQSLAWEVSASSYTSGHENIATVDAGIITGGAEGTTLVYAWDQAGNLLGRTAVTVLEGGLTVTAAQDLYALCPEQELQVGIQLNHPVPAALTWESADSAICSVDQTGLLTGHSFGDTTVRATLPGGSYAEVAIRVMPPITEMDFEKHLYKLKPDTTRQTQLNLQPLDAGEEVLWTTSDPAIATVSDTGLLTGHKYGTVTVTATGRYSGLTASCSVKVCDLKQVAITFDDGPGGYTAQLLDFLKENEIDATFFVLGQRLNSYKTALKRIVDEGHELGYHSYSHKQQTSLTTAKIISDYELSNQLAIDITGKGFTLWRTPGGGYSQRVLDAVPLPHILWAVDTLDWKTRNAEAVYKSIIRSSDDGEIILLHDIHKTSVQGAIKAMKEMQAGDYEFLTVTELLSRNGTPPQPHTTYKRAPK